METAPPNLYSVKLPAFEGPLDLLLHLIREHKVDIYDIPIATITEQYLRYIEIMKDLNLEIAGEFLVMAATLIHIKSRMMLPVEETADTDEPQDPRLELVQRLLQYRDLKIAALALQEREDEWLDIYIRPPAKEEEVEEEPPLFNINLFDLLSAFRRILDKAPPEIGNITKETLTIRDRMTHIIDILESAEALRFEDLFKDVTSRARLIVTFIALLELVRLGVAKAYQERDFGTLWVIRGEGKEEAVSEPEAVQYTSDDTLEDEE